jgi:hypothetical protein
MMKKLLTLLLVLGLASAASATVSLSLDGVNPIAATGEEIVAGATVSLYVISDDATAYMYDVTLADADATLGYPSINSNAGNMAGIVDWSGGGVTDYELTAADSGGNILAGIHFTMDLSPLGAAGTDFYVQLYEYGGPTIDDATINVVPEPMTIALLGLGGLFLRRRK